MPKLHGKTLIGTLSVLGALLIAVVWVRRIQNPVYEGVFLGDLLDRRNTESFLQAQRAVKVLGPRAVPYLTNVLANEPTDLQRYYGQIFMKMPLVFKRHLPAPKDPRMRRIRAAGLLHEAGANALPAIPLLIQAATEDGIQGVRHNALSSLGVLAPNTEFEPRAIETIVKATRSADLQQHAFWLLGGFTNDLNLVVPELLHGLRNTQTRESSLYALKRIGTNAMSVARETVKVEGYLPMSFDELERQISSGE